MVLKTSPGSGLPFVDGCAWEAGEEDLLALRRALVSVLQAVDGEVEEEGGCEAAGEEAVVEEQVVKRCSHRLSAFPP